MGKSNRGGKKMKELVLKRCKKCNALIKVLEDCKCEDCGIVCCGEPMEEVKANSVDASFERHLPTYEKEEDNIHIKVDHVMEEDHYIEWILVKTEKENREVILKPGDTSEMTVPYEKGALIYAYCNKHGLWKTVVE